MKEILLTKGKVTLVDDEDFEKLISFCWSAREQYGVCYATCKTKQVNKMRKTIYMTSLIIPHSAGKVVDHIDGNGLNNQKSNLRIVTQRENQLNRRKFVKPKTSKYPGVHLLKPRDPWRTLNKIWGSRIVIGGKHKYLGDYESELDAYTVYRVASVVLCGLDPEKICGVL